MKGKSLGQTIGSLQNSLGKWPLGFISRQRRSHTGPSLPLLLKDEPQAVIDTGFIGKALQIMEDELIKGISRDLIMVQTAVSSIEGVVE